MYHFYRSTIIILLIWGFSVATLNAQEATISGTVTDINGEPLIGATISIAEISGLGAAVNIDGEYTITVPASEVDGRQVTLVARFVSFRTQRAQITLEPGEINQDFELREDLLQLDEVVVTGQGGSVERRRLTSDVNILGSRDIEGSDVTSIDELMQGRIPGAQIRATSGQPGSAGLINFRGITSFTGSQTPTIYIDGVRVDNSAGTGFGTGGEQTSALSDILITDIERVEVTKGGAASTLYGGDAAAGVIQIFTKRGQAGQPRLQIRTQQGFDQPETKYIKDVGFSFPGLVEAGDADPDFVKNNFLRNGYFQSYYAGLSGGDSENNLSYNLSASTQNSEGVQPKNEHSNYTLRAGLRTLLAERFTVDFSASYTRSNFNRIFNGTAISDPLTAFEVGDALFFSGASTLDEALDIFLRPDIEESVDRFTFSTTFTHNPVENFTHSFVVGVDSRANEQRIFEPIAFPVTSDEGRLDRYNRDFVLYTFEYRANHSYQINEWLSSDLSFGAQGFRELESIITATGRNFALPGVKDFSAAADITASENRQQIFNGGFYVQEKLGFFDRAFLDLGVRVDGNSAYGRDVGLQVFPKIGVAYNLSEEDFWGDTFGDIWSTLRLRASFGQTGKFPTAFARDLTFSATPFRGESAPRFDNPGNLDLRPEVTDTYEVGVDMAFLDERLGINVTAFYSQTKDGLLPLTLEPVTGRTTQLTNVADMENVGIELDWNAALVQRRNFNWNFSGNFQTFRNEVTNLGTEPPFSIGVGGQLRVEEGQPIGAFYVNTPIDSNGDGLNDSFERQFTGKTAYPTTSGAFGTDIRFMRNWTFSAMADWATGHQVIDYGAAWAQFNGLNRVDFPTQFDEDGNDLGEYFYTDSFVSLLQPGDFLKLRSVSLGYQIPSNYLANLGVESARVSFSVRNALIFSKNDLVDPELNGVAGPGDLQLGGGTSITLPAPRQFRFTLQFTI